MTATISSACDRPDDDQRPEHVAVADLGDADARTPPIASPATSARPMPGRAAALVADPRHEDDGDERQPDAGDDQRRRHALEHDPDDDRDERRQDARDRRDDAHPADGEAPVQRGDPDRRRATPASDAQPRSAGVGDGSPRATASPSASDHPDELRDRARRRTAARGGSAGRRRSRRAPQVIAESEPEDDGRDPGAAELGQAPPARGGSAAARPLGRPGRRRAPSDRRAPRRRRRRRRSGPRSSGR